VAQDDGLFRQATQVAAATEPGGERGAEPRDRYLAGRPLFRGNRRPSPGSRRLPHRLEAEVSADSPERSTRSSGPGSLMSAAADLQGIPCDGRDRIGRYSGLAIVDHRAHRNIRELNALPIVESVPVVGGRNHRALQICHGEMPCPRLNETRSATAGAAPRWTWPVVRVQTTNSEDTTWRRKRLHCRAR